MHLSLKVIFHIICVVITISSNTNDMLKAPSCCGLYAMDAGSLFHKYIKFLHFFLCWMEHLVRKFKNMILNAK